MENPFKTDGVVWSNGKGMMLFDGVSFPIIDPPVFTFSYQSLYCEPTLIKKVIRDKDYELTPEEIAEVVSYIQEEKAKPRLVNGVDADGKFLQQVDRRDVVRIVREAPPPIPSKMWRLNPSNLFEQWDEVYPVDNDGYIMDPKGITDESTIHHIVREPIPPHNGIVRKWKYDFTSSQWIDGDIYEDRIKVLRERRVEEFEYIRRNSIKNLTVEYGGKTYDASTRSLEILVAAISIGKPSINWYPKNEVDPINLNSEDMKTLAMNIFNAQQELYVDYFNDKKAVFTTLDAEEIINYKKSVNSNNSVSESKNGKKNE